MAFTKEDFKSFPTDGDCIICPSGDYTAIKKIPKNCKFGHNSSFGPNAKFGYGVGFGNHCGFDQYSSFKGNNTFGDHCVFSLTTIFGCGTTFGDGCVFDYNPLFSDNTTFGVSCMFYGLQCKETTTPFIALSGITGSAITIYDTVDGLYIRSCLSVMSVKNFVVHMKAYEQTETPHMFDNVTVLMGLIQLAKLKFDVK